MKKFKNFLETYVWGMFFYNDAEVEVLEIQKTAFHQWCFLWVFFEFFHSNCSDEDQRMFITVRYFRRNYLELFCNKLFLKITENLLGALAVVSKFGNFTKKGCILKCFTKNCNNFFVTTILYKTPVINCICDSVQGYLILVCCCTKKPTDRKEFIL